MSSIAIPFNGRCDGDYSQQLKPMEKRAHERSTAERVRLANDIIIIPCVFPGLINDNINDDDTRSRASERARVPNTKRN